MATKATPSNRVEPEQLVERLIRGDREAMPLVVDRYGALVAAAVRRVTRSPADVEDVVQETWLALNLNVARIRQPERLASWLWSTATNAATHHAMRSRRCEPWDPDGFGDDKPDPQAVDPLGAVLDRERRSAALAALAALSRSDRRLILLLLQAEGLSYRSVSDLVGRPVGSLGPSRARILNKMRDQPSLYALLDDGAKGRGNRTRKRCRVEVVELERRTPPATEQVEPAAHLVVELAS